MANLDAVFHALSDGTRRAVVARLAQGPASVSELAAPHDMALPSFMKHLRVLEGCGLVQSAKKGRVRTCALCPDTARQAEGWLAGQRRVWTGRLDRLDAFLTAPGTKGPADESADERHDDEPGADALR